MDIRSIDNPEENKRENLPEGEPPAEESVTAAPSGEPVAEAPSGEPAADMSGNALAEAAAEEKKRLKKRSLTVLILCLALAAAAAAAGLVFSRNVMVGGKLYPRDAAELDLRDAELSVSRYEALTEKLPGCDIRWSVPVGDRSADSQAELVYVGEISMEDVEHFAYFQRLSCIDGTNSENYDVLLALREAYPDVKVKWGVSIGGHAYGQGTQSLRIAEEDLDAGELMDSLCWLPQLKSVTALGTLSPEEEQALSEKYPDIFFDWYVELCGKTFRSADRVISFAGETVHEEDLQEIAANISRFPNLEVVDLTGCGFENQRMLDFRQELGGVEVSWDLEVCGVPVNSLDTTLVLSEIPIDDVSVVEEALPYFSRLERVEMHHCGVPNEVMDTLNRKYEDIRFVWTVRVGFFGVKTDASYYIVYNCKEHYSADAGTSQLKYCTDLIALDLGHMRLKDISFLQYMPHMKYLIFAECAITDISYIGDLKELEWLELFKASIRDITPLLGCTNLKHLNLCYIYADDSAYDTLIQMTWLDRLWYCGNWMSPQHIQSLEETLVDTEIYMEPGGESTGGGWRYDTAYYEMRDAFHMYYMDEKGNRTTIRRDQE